MKREVRVTADPKELWDAYARLDIDARIAAGKLKVTDDKVEPGGSKSGQPPGTKSIMELITGHDGMFVALVHCFERPDGTRTRRDPKRIIVGAIDLRYRKPRQ